MQIQIRNLLPASVLHTTVGAMRCYSLQSNANHKVQLDFRDTITHPDHAGRRVPFSGGGPPHAVERRQRGHTSSVEDSRILSSRPQPTDKSCAHACALRNSRIPILPTVYPALSRPTLFSPLCNSNLRLPSESSFSLPLLPASRSLGQSLRLAPRSSPLRGGCGGARPPPSRASEAFRTRMLTLPTV